LLLSLLLLLQAVLLGAWLLATVEANCYSYCLCYYHRHKGWAAD
jgi:hypothetical protein